MIKHQNGKQAEVPPKSPKHLNNYFLSTFYVLATRVFSQKPPGGKVSENSARRSDAVKHADRISTIRVSAAPRVITR